MKILNYIALALLIIGGINWLLIGLFQFDIVTAIFGGETGEKPLFARVIYGVIGLCALYAFRFITLIKEEQETRRELR